MQSLDALHILNAKVLAEGTAESPVITSTTPLSFWGGVSPLTGEVIDRKHPLSGTRITGKILAIPSGRGSCSGSGTILELIHKGLNPSALVLEHEEDILTLGIIIAQEFFGKSIPVLRLSSPDFGKLTAASYAKITGGMLFLYADVPSSPTSVQCSIPKDAEHDEEIKLPPGFELSEYDDLVLNGSMGKAAQAAGRVVLRMALIQGATSLIDVTRVHVDGCFYTGEASLLLPKRLLDLGGKVRVPTTLNSISIDRRRWRAQGVNPAAAAPSEELADVYERLGARATYTCAPYLLEDSTPPQMGEQVGWTESNAVVYANSALGARTMKYPDYLDICIALTGRAPRAGCHVADNRRARIQIAVPPLLLRPPLFDDSLFPLLGYLVGDVARTRIPIVTGLEEGVAVSDVDLKAFGAAFATTSGAPMFHIAGVTAEARSAEDRARHLATADVAAALTITTMAAAWRRLDKAPDTTVDLVALGSPHFGLEELASTVALTRGRTKSPGTEMMITCGRDTYRKAQLEADGGGSSSSSSIVRELTEFGAKIITDTCWCFIEEPVIPKRARVTMTNSAKYAHYGEGLTDRTMRFGGLAQCVEAACTGVAEKRLPEWLRV